MLKKRHRVVRVIGWSLAGVLSLVVTLVLTAVILLHTDYGRNKVRVQVEAQLDDLFVGGAKIGKLEGSPFGTLVARDVVVAGADGKPAVTIGRLAVRVGLWALVTERVHVRELEIDDADVVVPQLAGLMKQKPEPEPAPEPESSKPSPWTIDVDELAVRRAHVHVNADTDLDGIAIDARVHAPIAGDKTVSIDASATWRQRAGAPIAAIAELGAGSDNTALELSSLQAHVGDVVAAAAGVHVTLRTGKLPVVVGSLAITAPRDAVAALMPDVDLPGDASLAIETTDGATSSATPVTVVARLGDATLSGALVADLDKQAAHGSVAVTGGSADGEIDIAALTQHAVDATGAATIRFDLATGAPGDLPTGSVDIAARGRFGNIPHATVDAKLVTTADRATAKLELRGPATANVSAEVVKAGDVITLESAKIVASTDDPKRTSGGVAPVRGALHVDLAARGVLAPDPDVAVHGTVTGGKLAAAGVSVEQLSVAIDAASLPAKPTGHVHMHVTALQRGDVQLGELLVGAASRPDGKIAVDITSHPGFAAWAVELAALVTPPGTTGTTTVELGKHHIRAGAKGGDWAGEGGKLVIAPDRIAVTDLHSASDRGRFAIAASLDRTGQTAGDLVAKVDVADMQLAALGSGYGGVVTAHVAVARRALAWSGAADLDAKGVALGSDPQAAAQAASQGAASIGSPRAPQAGAPGISLIDAVATLSAGPGAVAIDSTIAFVGVPLPKPPAAAAGAAPRPPEKLLDNGGDQPRDLRKPAARDHRPAATSGDPLAIPAPTGPGGRIRIAASVRAPQHLDDVAAWQRLGRDALTSLQLRFEHVELGHLAALAPAPQTSPSAGPAAGPSPSASAPRLAIAGQLDGELAVTPTGVTGSLHATGVRTPALRGIRSVDAAVAIAQPTPDEIDPTIILQAADVGNAVAVARIALPAHPFAPGAFTTAAVRGASIATSTIAIDPAMLDRLGITSTARGKVQLHVEIADRLRAATVTATIRDLRGVPIAKPVDLDITAAIDDHAATAKVAMTADRTVHMLDLDAKLPITLAELLADPVRANTAALTATMRLPETSAPRLLDVFGKTEVTGGTLAGTVEVTGSIADPHVVAKLTGSDLAIPPGPNGKPVDTVHEVTVDATWDSAHGGHVAVDASGAGGGTLAVRAVVNPRKLADATAQITAAHFDLAPLLAFAPGPAGGAKAKLDAKLAIAGLDPSTAHITGELHLRDARLPVAPSVGTLRDASVDLVIREHDIGIKASGKLGGGTLVLDGSIALDGASLTGGTVKLTLRKVSPIGSVQPAIDADVSAKLVRAGTQWKADVTVDHGFIKIGSTSGEKLKPVGTPDDLVVGKANKPGERPTSHEVAAAPKNPIVVAHIVLHDTNVEADQFRTTLKGDLTMSADASAIGMTGGIEAMGGNVDLFDRRYRIERAAVRFDGTIDPTLDVLISYDFPDVTTNTQVRGRLSKPELELASDPGIYSKSQLLGFLLGGEPGGDPSSGGARDKAEQAGESFVANQIGSYVKSALPIDIDVIKYEAASVSSSAAITVGSWVTHTLFFSFRQHLDARPDENSDEGTLEWWLTHRLEVEATAGDRNFDGVDMLWRRRF